jgi:hypothetical protein
MTKAKASQLTAHVCDIGFRVYTRVNSCNDRVLLGWQSETVIPKCVQDVESVHAFVTRENISSYVAKRVTNVQSGAGRVRKHVENK